MLVFNEKDKYSDSVGSDHIRAPSVVQEKSFPSSNKIHNNSIKKNQKKLTKTNIQFLKSLALKLNPQLKQS